MQFIQTVRSYVDCEFLKRTLVEHKLLIFIEFFMGFSLRLLNVHTIMQLLSIHSLWLSDFRDFSINKIDVIAIENRIFNKKNRLQMENCISVSVFSIEVISIDGRYNIDTLDL